MHANEIIKIAKQKINIFVEKPICTNNAQIKKIEHVLKNTNVKTMVGYQLKFNPIINLLKNKKAFLVPTLIIYQALIEQGVEAGLSKEMVNKTYEVLDAGIEALSFAEKNDVQIVYGTDLLGIMHPRQLEEFNLRSKVIEPLKLLQQATVNASKLFSMEDKIGQVKEGFNADLIVLKSSR